MLDHTLFGHELVKRGTVPLNCTAPHTWSRDGQLAWLLHDAHEAITGDVPTDVKGDDLKSTQAQLDGAIYRAFGAPADLYSPGVKLIDRRCLLAEAAVVGAPGSGAVFDAKYGPPDPDDVALLEAHLRGPDQILGYPPRAMDQSNHVAVKEYLNRMLHLL